MAKTAKRAALYVRVSTDHQTVENQIQALRQIAERRGWDVVETYRDAGISGAKGRDQRSGLDALLKDSCRRKFDVVMAWAIDRLGRSLIDLLGTIQHLEAVGVALPRPAGHRHDHASRQTAIPDDRCFRRVRTLHDTAACPRRAARHKDKIARDGKFTSKTGKVRRRLGRPGAEPPKLELARRELAKGTGIGKTARLTGLGTGTVHRLKREMVTA